MKKIHNSEEKEPTNETKHLTFKTATTVRHPVHTVVTSGHLQL